MVLSVAVGDFWLCTVMFRYKDCNFGNLFINAGIKIVLITHIFFKSIIQSFIQSTCKEE